MRTALLTALLFAPLALSAQTTEPAVRLSLNENGEYEAGDNARVRVRTEQDGYLVVLRTEVDGWIRVLYPVDPFQDHFVRGGREFEVRGRGDREAFQASRRGGSGTVLAAYSAHPFDFTEFDRNGHWDYRVLDTLKSGSDPEAALLAIVDQMADSAGVDYDVLSYTVGGNGSSATYASSYSYQPWRYSFSSSYYYDYYSYYDWYRPYYRPYYRSYYSCFFCYSPGWYVGFSYGYRPSWAYRSYYYGNYASYRRTPRYGLARLAFNQWNGGGSAGRALRNARTGVVEDRSRYTADLANRRRSEFSVTQPVTQSAVARRAVSAPTPSGSGETARVARRVTPEGGSGTVMRRETASGDRSFAGRREVATSGRASGNGSSGTIRRVDVPERRSVDDRGFSSSGRTSTGGRTVNDGGDGGRSVSRDRPSYSGEGRRSPNSYGGGGRVSGGERASPSRDGGSRPSSGGGGGRVSDGGGRRSPGGSSAPAPSRGSSRGNGGDRGAPSSGEGGRRRG